MPCAVVSEGFNRDFKFLLQGLGNYMYLEE